MALTPYVVKIMFHAAGREPHPVGRTVVCPENWYGTGALGSVKMEVSR